MATNNIEKQSFGQAGATCLSGTENVTKEICAILALEDSVLHATNTAWPELTDSSTSTLIGETSSVIIPAGVKIRPTGKIRPPRKTRLRIQNCHPRVACLKNICQPPR